MHFLIRLPLGNEMLHMSQSRGYYKQTEDALFPKQFRRKYQLRDKKIFVKNTFFVLLHDLYLILI